MITDHEQEQIEKMKSKVRKDPDILAFIHFGSSIHESVYKDIDLCLITNNSLSIDKKIEYKLYLPEHYEIHFFHDLPLYIRHEVLATGLFLLNKDEDRIFDIVYQFIKQFADFEPHFKKYLEIIKDA